MSKTKNLQLKPLVIALVAVAIGVFGGFVPGNQRVAHAEFTGGTATSDKNLYIPNDYIGTSDGTGDILVKAGAGISKLKALDVTFGFDPTKIEIYNVADLALEAHKLYGKGTPTISASNNTFRVNYVSLSELVLVNANDTLFRLRVHIKSSVVGPTDISIWTTENPTIKKVVEPNPDIVDVTYTTPRFRDGKISVLAATCSPECGEYGSCKPDTKTCECNLGYMGVACKQCAAGYTGYPKCVLDVFSNLKGVILTLSPDTVSKLTVEERKKAYSSVYVIFKAQVTNFAQKIKLGTAEYDLACISHAPDELAKIRECTEVFKGNMEDPDIGPGWKASVVNGMSGVVKLEPQGSGATLDGITSTTGDVLVVPGMDYTLVLDPLGSYKTRVIGVLDSTTFALDGVTILSSSHVVKDMNFNDVKWMPQPTNRLKSSALAGGLLERGDEVGTGPLYVEMEKSDKSKVQSNQLTVEVPGGPQIDYARVIGAGSIERGARVNLSVKVSDVDTISDIQDILTSIVRPTDPSPTKNTTYAEIRADATATWFTENKFVDVSKVITENVTVPATPPATPPVTPAAGNYRIYQIPVEIPQDTGLVDGNYKLVLIITDKAGHSSTAVIPLRLGKVASGDVNGDGKISMLDVILAYQISNGKITGTPAQIEAANLDGKGNVTMMDVVLLFNKVNKK